MKQFIVDRHTTPNTPTLEQVPTDKIPIYATDADAEADLANLAVGQIIGITDTGDELAQPVNVVESGNLHAVTSNAVANLFKDIEVTGTTDNNGFIKTQLSTSKIALSVSTNLQEAHFFSFYKQTTGYYSILFTSWNGTPLVNKSVSGTIKYLDLGA